MNTTDSIATRIQYLIRSKGLRINALATKIGLSGQGLRDILSGKSKAPKADVVMALAQELNVSTDWLLFGSDNATGAQNFSGFELREGFASYGRAKPARSILMVLLQYQEQFLQSYPHLDGLADLPRFHLPEQFPIKGEPVAFEVEDDNLAPDIRAGSIVICGAEQSDLRYLASGHLYALSFAGHFAIRRVNNLMDTDGVLELMAGAGYAPNRVPASQVQQVWRVQYVVQRV